MKKTFVRAAFAAALLCTTAGVTLMASPHAAYADDQPKLTRAVGEALNGAIKAAQANDFKTAQDDIKTADAVADKTDFDNYKINAIRAFVAISQKDYAAADAAYEAMAASPVMPKDEVKSTLHNAVLLASMSKHWPQVIKYVTQLQASGASDDKMDSALANAYYQTNDFPHAAAVAQKLIDAALTAHQKPDHDALVILENSLAQQKDEAGAERAMEQFTLYYGGPKNWSNLIDIAFGTPHMQELDALYLYRLRFLCGATTSNEDYSYAAGIALKIGYPAEAQSDLEKGISSGALSSSGKTAGLLSQARSGARTDEHSLKAIAAAAEHAKSGEQAVKLAEDYWGYGRYADAAAAAQQGIAKGYPRDPGEGHFILGIALIAQGKYDDGRAALAKVTGSPARTKAVHLWDLYAQSKVMQAVDATTPAPAPTKAQ